MRRRAFAHAGDDVAQSLLGLDMAADDVDEVNQSARRQPARDLQPLRLVDAALHVFVANHARADEEIRADALANRAQHLDSKAHAVVERAAIIVVAPVGQRRPELIHQMAVSLDLQPVEPRRLHPLGGVGVMGDDARDVEILHRLGKCAMRGFADMARREDGQPVVLGPARAPAEMGDLNHHRRAERMHIVRQRLQPADDLVFVQKNVAERLRAVRRDDSRAANHRQPDAALGLLDVIGAVAVFRHPVMRVSRLMRRRHQTIADRQMFQLERLQQRVGAHEAGSLAKAGRLYRPGAGGWAE